jgi:hypothetical protein
MTRDELLLLSLLAAFATFVTVHLTIVFGLARRAPRWKAIPALAIVPLAPYWGAQAGMWGRAVVWVVSAVAYTLLRFASRS